jgi:hypothetical protein
MCLIHDNHRLKLLRLYQQGNLPVQDPLGISAIEGAIYTQLPQNPVVEVSWREFGVCYIQATIAEGIQRAYKPAKESRFPTAAVSRKKGKPLTLDSIL